MTVNCPLCQPHFSAVGSQVGCLMFRVLLNMELSFAVCEDTMGLGMVLVSVISYFMNRALEETKDDVELLGVVPF